MENRPLQDTYTPVRGIYIYIYIYIYTHGYMRMCVYTHTHVLSTCVFMHIVTYMHQRARETSLAGGAVPFKGFYVGLYTRIPQLLFEKPQYKQIGAIYSCEVSVLFPGSAWPSMVATKLREQREFIQTLGGSTAHVSLQNQTLVC